MRSRILAVYLFMLMLPFTYASTVSSADIVTQSLQSMNSCLHYQVKGLCFWLHCTIAGCNVISTLKVSHYLPDTVVSVYRDKTSNPWDYARDVVDPLAYQFGEQELQRTLQSSSMGFGNESMSAASDSNNHFKEADVIGNPALLIFNRFPKIFLPSKVNPFSPFYLSMADSFMWRSPLKEMMFYPENLIPGRREVGDIVNDWGNLFPRTGFINQPDDFKAAAVIANRAIDIAANPRQPHFYQALPGCGKHCKVFPVKENSVDANTWQMLYPNSDNQCRIFGGNNFGGKKKAEGNAVFVLWRHYEGCIPGDGRYLYEVNF